MVLILNVEIHSYTNVYYKKLFEFIQFNLVLKNMMLYIDLY